MLQPTFDGTALTCSDRESWLEARRQGLGATDAAVVLGVSPWKSAYRLYHEKLGLATPDRAETEAMEWGKVLEAPIADRYARETGRAIIDPGAFTIRRALHPPFALATLDREIVGDDRGPGVLEVKTASAFLAKEWEGEDAPLQYLVQVQHQLAVTGYAWGSLAVLIGGQRFRWLDVERNDRFIEQMLEREAEFWDRLSRQDPPPVDGSESTRGLLAEIFPRDDGSVVSLPEDALQWDAQLCAAKEAIKVAEAQKLEAENQIKAAIGAATKGMVNGIAYSFKSQTREEHIVKGSTFRVLRRVKA